MNYYKELCKHYGKDSVELLDTNHFKKKLISNILYCIRIAGRGNAVIIMPTNTLIKPLSVLFNLLKLIFKFKLYYVVVGGWLPEVVEQRPSVAKQLKKLDGILVEAYQLKERLEKCGLKNVYYSPNFSTRKAISKNEIVYSFSEPFMFCTFSRVTKTKGILEAIYAVEKINENAGKNKCCLDIYGSIDETFRDEFEDVLKHNNGIIKYKGVLLGDEIVPVLSNYFAMLFPTYYHGECFPGAVAEAMMGGVPVIATDWRYNKEIIQEKVTGLIYSYKDQNQIIGCMESLMNSEKTALDMRNNSWRESLKYSPETVMQILYDLMEGV
jgi:glycosyltransferase involved in cell wall biosynthesis